MSSEVALLPSCKVCGCALVLRSGFDGHGNGTTAEQRWCGVWYDHPPTRFGAFGHTSSVLLPSPELASLSVGETT